jgi:phosphoglycerol transferase MdoB-like AlkP superfamily enzyme
MNDFISFIPKTIMKKTINSSELLLVQRQLAHKSLSRKQNNYTGIGKGYNVLAIQIESIQHFVIARKYNGKEITPNLNRLINTGIDFHNIYDQTSTGNSSDAMFLAKCSLYPAAKGTIAFHYSHNNFDSLTKLLSENGYTTMLLHAYYKDFWNYEALDKSFGFKKRHYQDDYTIDDVIGMGLSDRSFFSQSIEKIKSLPVPFYVHMRTLTTHDPFEAVTSKIDDFPTGVLGNKVMGRYIKSMHYVDSAIGAFLRDLSKVGLLSHTVIVIYGDHRARLPEDQLHLIGSIDKNEINKIPLIISNPQWKIEDTNNSVGGLIDLAPTISNILGVDCTKKVFLGNDLGNNRPGYVIFRDGSFISPTGQINLKSAREELIASDIIIEKDCIPKVRKQAENINSMKRTTNSMLSEPFSR